MHNNDDHDKLLTTRSIPLGLTSSSRKASLISNRLSFAPKRGFPHPGHPSQKYALNWKINQAGQGWLSLGNYFGYSTVLIKKREAQKERSHFSALQSAFHPNVVRLVEAFHDEGLLYLVYNYDGLVVNLSQVTTTPTVVLGELEIAGISRGILRGLEYVHESLGIGHGKIDGDNILLCPEGIVKIANIGDAMIQEHHAEFFDDREKLRALVLALSQSRDPNDDSFAGKNQTSGLAFYARHFAEQLVSAPYSCLFEHVFLEQVGVGDRAWYLIPPYLDTILHWGVLRA